MNTNERQSDGQWAPAGFWIRVVAVLIDGIVLSPLAIASYFAYFRGKSLPLILLVNTAGFVYKPFMESRYGATLGKMACGLRVIDQRGNRLSISAAYVRFLPWLAYAAAIVIETAWAFSMPQIQTASTFHEISQLMRQTPLEPLSTILNLFLIIDCATAAFTDRKRAIHDMIAGSYCVWKVA